MNRGRRILLVENDENDRIFFARALAKITIPTLLKTVNDGPAAINYLEGNGIYADRSQYPFPDIVVCDLKMPKDGFEFLKWRNASHICSLPVVVLEGSGYKSDHERARRMGANLVFEKPNDLERLASIATEIATFDLQQSQPTS